MSQLRNTADHFRLDRATKYLVLRVWDVKNIDIYSVAKPKRPLRNTATDWTTGHPILESDPSDG